MHAIRIAALAGLLAGAPLAAQTFKTDISLSGLGNGSPARPFGITAEPASARLFVAVAGDLYGGANNVVAIVDPVTESVVGTIQVGLFPEDIAFAYDAGGAVRYGAVTNSSDGTVTIWDGSDRVAATVPLPDPLGFGTCYPFGITASEDGSLFYVSTVDGSGAVYALNLATLAYDPARSFNIGPVTGGRLRHMDNMACVPWSRFDASFTGAEGGVTGWSTGPLPFYWERVLVNRFGQYIYPGGSDLEVLPDGRRVLGGMFFDNRLYLYHRGGVLDRTVRQSTGSGSAHGLGLSPDGTLLAACDLASDEVALLDMLNYRQLSAIHLPSVGQGYYQPNEAVIWAGKLYVTCQGSEEVVVFDNLPTPTPGPGYTGTIAVSDSAPAPGGSVTVTVTGPGLVALLGSFDDVPTVIQGVELDIGPAPAVLGFGPGGFTKTFNVPPNPALRGHNHFFQGVTDARGARRPTEPRVVVVQ